MRKLVLLLGLYGWIAISLIYFPLQPYYNQSISSFPTIKYGDLIVFLYFLWAGVGVFFLLYFWIPKASNSTKKNSPLFLWAYWIFSLIHVEGQSIHLAANSIHNSVTGEISENLARSIYFYDEILSHTLLFGAALALAGVTIIYQNTYRTHRKLSKAEVLWLIICGLLYGVGFATAMLEGQTAIWQWPILLLMVIVMSSSLFSIRSDVLRLPAWIFFLPGFLLMLILLGIWFIYFGSFIEPSEAFLLF